MRNSLDIPKAPSATRVVVAMSGGVDSSVAAAMMKAEGYDVVGVTLQLYDHGAATHRKGACCAGQDILDARRVAERLDIPHYVLDYEARFRTAVIDAFANSYVAGETPVPCVSCNQRVKFRDLLETSRDLEADVLVTGHYVASEEIHGKRALFRPVDVERDQSYFLFATTAEQLNRLRFPLGTLTKAQTRAIARDHGLMVADKPDSQDICFVPSGHYAEVIERLRPGASEPGDIVHIDGRHLGTHPGIIHYTIGQRRGLGVAAGEPLYVVKIDAAKRHVIVGPRSALATHVMILREVNWLGDHPLADVPAEGLEVFVRVRSTRPPRPALIKIKDEAVHVILEGGEDGVSPGQACVFYDAAEGPARVLGGGFIAATRDASLIDHSGAAMLAPLSSVL